MRFSLSPLSFVPPSRSKWFVLPTFFGYWVPRPPENTVFKGIFDTWDMFSRCIANLTPPEMSETSQRSCHETGAFVLCSACTGPPTYVTAAVSSPRIMMGPPLFSGRPLISLSTTHPVNTIPSGAMIGLHTCTLMLRVSRHAVLGFYINCCEGYHIVGVGRVSKKIFRAGQFLSGGLETCVRQIRKRSFVGRFYRGVQQGGPSRLSCYETSHC